MSQIEVDKVIPQSGTALQVGDSGDTITIPAGATITNNGTANGFGSADTEKVKVSANDTTAGFLNGKLVAGTNISLTEGNDGGNETLTAALTGTIATAQIADDAVTLAKMAPGTDGNIISYDASGNPVAVATGSAGQVLTSAGAGAPPTFSTAASSDFVLLSSTTPSAANTMSIDGHFTSDYDIYKIYAIGMSGSGMSNTRLSFRVNVGGTAQTGGSYYFQTVNSSKTTLAVWADNTGGTSADLGYVHSSSGSTKQGNLEMTIFRPLGTDVTGMLHEMLAWDNGTDGGKYMGSTFYNVATAISGITLGVGAFGSGNIEADRILVYGMKNS